MNYSAKELVTPVDLDVLIEELSNLKTREMFDSSMRRFEESYLHRYKAANPYSPGQFPFGSLEIPRPTYQSPQVSYPYSSLGSFYQGESQRPAPYVEKLVYSEPYSIPMHQRGRSGSPMTYVRTEYVPYPYPLHPPHEYSHPVPDTREYKRNPLRESMDLRRVKEEMFNQSYTGMQRYPEAPPMGYRENMERSRENFPSFFSRK